MLKWACLNATHRTIRELLSDPEFTLEEITDIIAVHLVNFELQINDPKRLEKMFS